MIDVVLSSYSTTSVNHFNHTQLHPLQVIKRNVDSFEPGKMIPNCQLSAEFSSSAGQKVPSLKHRVKLLGAKDPFDTFLIKSPVAMSATIATSGTIYIMINYS